MATFCSNMLNKLKYFSVYYYITVISAAFVTKNWTIAVSSISIWTLLIYYRELRLHLKMLPHDIRFIVYTSMVVYRMKMLQFKQSNYAMEFQKIVKKQPNKIALIHENDHWTFRQVEEYSNQIANYFKDKFKDGDVVALYMENRPEFLCVWLGLAKIGVITALVNTNQKLDALLHSINSVNAKYIIYGSELWQGIEEIKDKIIDKPLYQVKNKYIEGSRVTGSLYLEDEIENVSKTSPDENISALKCDQKLLFIYTSGTTGFPKAAIINHEKAYTLAHAMKTYFRIVDADVIYTVLPLYHTAGGLAGSGLSLVGGCTQVIKTKFSATQFWSDCIKYNCTVAQYIGEICRYLLAVPECPEERSHRVRLMFGNGLRPQIWEQFTARFNIKKIGEMYGSTEGNANMLNIANKVGSCGRVPWFLRNKMPSHLIKVDAAINKPIRDKDGLCIICKPGEPGLLIGEILESSVFNYDGYSDKSATDDKIILDVFRKGDKAFNTGDILTRDEEDFFYFKDRTGDTFRWKGENVSTCEVEAAISNIVHLQDTIVYGVDIPNVEGKPGMVTIADQNNLLNLKQIADGIKKSLPRYARPLFLRINKELNLTGTFKLMKTDLQKDGFNPNKISDPVYYMDKFDQYVPLTPDVYQEIVTGKMKL